jgi:hypothetical protein
VLLRLHAEAPGPLCILQVRSRALCETLVDCPAEELAELAELAEYLQLPKFVTARVQEHTALQPLRQRLAKKTRGRVLLAFLLNRPELRLAAESAQALLDAAFGDWGRRSRLVLNDTLYDGAAGNVLPAIPAGASPHEVRAHYGCYVAGQIMAGNRPLSDVPVRASGAPCIAAAFIGDLDVLRTLHGAGWPMDDVLEGASRGGQIAVLDWQLQRTRRRAGAGDAGRGAFDAETVMQFAARYGQVDVLRWALEQGFALCPGLDVDAAAAGQMSVVRFICERVVGFARDGDGRAGRACAAAAGRGDLPMLEYLASQGYTLGPCLLDRAAWSGDVRVLGWVRLRGLEWTARACAIAASRGHLAALQWLRAQEPPCPWSSEVVHKARARQHLELAAWAEAQGGCPTPEDDFAY